MTGTAVVASQFAGTVAVYVIYAGEPCRIISCIGLGHVPGMTVMMPGLLGIAGLDRRHCHAVLTEWHRNCSVALRREPQRHQHAEEGSPAVHVVSIGYGIQINQFSEPVRGIKVPRFPAWGANFFDSSVALLPVLICVSGQLVAPRGRSVWRSQNVVVRGSFVEA